MQTLPEMDLKDMLEMADSLRTWINEDIESARLCGEGFTEDKCRWQRFYLARVARLKVALESIKQAIEDYQK